MARFPGRVRFLSTRHSQSRPFPAEDSNAECETRGRIVPRQSALILERRGETHQDNLPVNSPANLLHSAKLFVRRHGLALGLLVLAAFKLWLIHTEEIYGSATEYDALWFVNAAKHWYWGAEYSWTAFVRPPAYPLFIAFVHLCALPLRIGIELMQMAGYLILV